MKHSWLIFICFNILAVLLGTFIWYNKTSGTHNKAPSCIDSYSYHPPDSTSPAVCFGAGQKLKMERMGNTMGAFEYSCKCE